MNIVNHPKLSSRKIVTTNLPCLLNWGIADYMIYYVYYLYLLLQCKQLKPLLLGLGQYLRQFAASTICYGARCSWPTV